MTERIRQLMILWRRLRCIHTYSLIHDDLPAMDNDEYRRGKKTTHAVYGEAMAILAGDALLNYAFETVAAALTRNEGDWRIVRAFSVLAQKAGIYGMIGGQVVDVESEKTGQTIDREPAGLYLPVKNRSAD